MPFADEGTPGGPAMAMTPEGDSVPIFAFTITARPPEVTQDGRTNDRHSGNQAA